MSQQKEKLGCLIYKFIEKNKLIYSLFKSKEVDDDGIDYNIKRRHLTLNLQIPKLITMQEIIFLPTQIKQIKKEKRIFTHLGQQQFIV